MVKMLSVQLLLLVSPALAWIPVGDWESGNVTASVSDSGQCLCHVYVPDTTFPADRVEHMQQVSKDMIIEVDIQMNKLVSSESKLDVHLKELSELVVRVAMLESSSDKYIKLDFELIRIELREFEALVSQLRESLNVSSPLFDSLYTEIQNMTLIVNQLETYDKSNLEVIRIEFAKLQKKLEDCQQDQNFKPDIGNCNGTGITSLSPPNVIQLNAALSNSYVFGGWGKDSKPLRGYENMYVFAAYTSQWPNIYDFYLYRDYEKLLLRSTFKHYDLPSDWLGTGNNFAVRGHSIYYQRGSNQMCKINVTTDARTYRVISEASGSFTYSYSGNQILDFAGDENGLWVMYASEASKGKLVVAKIDEKSFGIEDEWNTNVYKRLSGNAFMACGVMYATRTVDLNTEEIFYSLDTRTGVERQLSIPFKKFLEKYSYLDYNPTDQKLYMYNDGYYVSYNVRFN